MIVVSTKMSNFGTKVTLRGPPDGSDLLTVVLILLIFCAKHKIPHFGSGGFITFVVEVALLLL